LKSSSLLFFLAIAKWRKSGELLTLINEQKKNPIKWLYPVVEYIDLNRQLVGTLFPTVFITLDGQCQVGLHRQC